MPNVLSIFSGGGGIDCGFKKAGFTICFSTDLWKHLRILEMRKNMIIELRNMDINYEYTLEELGV